MKNINNNGLHYHKSTWAKFSSTTTSKTHPNVKNTQMVEMLDFACGFRKWPLLFYKMLKYQSYNSIFYCPTVRSSLKDVKGSTCLTLQWRNIVTQWICPIGALEYNIFPLQTKKYNSQPSRDTWSLRISIPSQLISQPLDIEPNYKKSAQNGNFTIQLICPMGAP